MWREVKSRMNLKFAEVLERLSTRASSITYSRRSQNEARLEVERARCGGQRYREGKNQPTRGRSHSVKNDCRTRRSE